MKKALLFAAGLGILLWTLFSLKSLETVSAENGISIRSLLEESGFTQEATTIMFLNGSADLGFPTTEITAPEVLEQFYSQFLDRCYLSDTHLRTWMRWDRSARHYALRFTTDSQEATMTFYLCGVKNTYVTWQDTDFFCTADTVGSIKNILPTA